MVEGSPPVGVADIEEADGGVDRARHWYGTSSSDDTAGRPEERRRRKAVSDTLSAAAPEAA